MNSNNITFQTNSNIIFNSDAYVINLKKDYGRNICSQNLLNVFNAKFFTGYDCNKLDDKNCLYEIQKKSVYTMSAKKSKEILLNKFLTTSKKEYLIIFEDDVYLHTDLLADEKKNHIFLQINLFLAKTKPKLLYFGISRHFKSDNLDTSNISFVSFNNKFGGKIEQCSGAYGFAISRDVVKLLLMRVQNETIKELPFDLFCLSYISKAYPNDSFVINPHLVIPNIESSNIRESFSQDIIWNLLETNKELYHMPFLGYVLINKSSDELSINSTNSTNSTNLTDRMIRAVEPLMKIVYYDSKSNKPIDLIPDKKKLLLSPNIILAKLIKPNQINYFSAKQIISTILENKSHTKILDSKGDIIMNLMYFDVENISDVNGIININHLILSTKINEEEFLNRNVVVSDL